MMAFMTKYIDKTIEYITSLTKGIYCCKIILILLIIFNIIVACYEARITSRIHRKLSNNEANLENDITISSFNKIKNRTLHDMIKLKPILETQPDVFRTEQLLRDLFRPKKSNIHFSHALLAIGLLESSDSIRSSEFNAVENYCNKYIDNSGNLLYKIEYLDDCIIGYIICELYERTHKEKYRVAAKIIANYLMNEYPKTSIGTLPYFRKYPEVMLIDDKGEICSFLVRYGEIFNVPEATNLGVLQLSTFMKNSIDRESGLPYHAYDISVSRKIGQLGWLRGIGWLCIGLSDSLKYLPKDHERYDELKEGYIKLLSVLRLNQSTEQCWPWAIGNTLAEEDTSGTAMIGYSVESSIRSGIIDISFANMSENALKGILRHTNSDGIIGNALADCDGVGHYPNIFGPSNFAQGPATALYALILKRHNVNAR